MATLKINNKGLVESLTEGGTLVQAVWAVPSARLWRGVNQEPTRKNALTLPNRRCITSDTPTKVNVIGALEHHNMPIGRYDLARYSFGHSVTPVFKVESTEYRT